ncbi:hypothetical protein DFH09DRAFT_1276125 [Mycena vulgaris]|nr:hypothetical protein DFH09DRAFT_1276125 [Mycena vulgaris]
MKRMTIDDGLGADRVREHEFAHDQDKTKNSARRIPRLGARMSPLPVRFRWLLGGEAAPPLGRCGMPSGGRLGVLCSESGCESGCEPESGDGRPVDRKRFRVWRGAPMGCRESGRADGGPVGLVGCADVARNVLECKRVIGNVERRGRGDCGRASAPWIRGGPVWNMEKSAGTWDSAPAVHQYTSGGTVWNVERYSSVTWREVSRLVLRARDHHPRRVAPESARAIVRLWARSTRFGMRGGDEALGRFAEGGGGWWREESGGMYDGRGGDRKDASSSTISCRRCGHGARTQLGRRTPTTHLPRELYRAGGTPTRISRMRCFVHAGAHWDHYRGAGHTHRAAALKTRGPTHVDAVDGGTAHPRPMGWNVVPLILSPRNGLEVPVSLRDRHVRRDSSKLKASAVREFGRVSARCSAAVGRRAASAHEIWATKRKAQAQPHPDREDVAFRSRRTLALTFKAPSSLWCTGWGCCLCAAPPQRRRGGRGVYTHLVRDSRSRVDGVGGDERIPRAAQRLMHSDLWDAVRGCGEEMRAHSTRAEDGGSNDRKAGVGECWRRDARCVIARGGGALLGELCGASHAGMQDVAHAADSVLYDGGGFDTYAEKCGNELHRET